MKKDTKLKLTVTALCCIVTTLFFLLYTYLFFFEHTSVYSSRHAHTYDTLTQYSASQIKDDSAPIGVRTEYRMILQYFDSSESCLCFYLPHHYADVYIEDELVHSLTISENNHISDTPSNNWITVPIHEEDSGKELTLVLTPLFENVVNFEPEFLVGSHYSIVVAQFKADMLQLFISLLCIILSIFIVISQSYFMLKTKTQTWNMFYLAGFALMLGIWRMASTKSSPILFSNNTLTLSYISVGSLFLCSLFLQLFASTFFTQKRRKQYLFITSISCLVLCLVWLLQILNIAEFSQMIDVSRILLAVTILSILVFSWLSRKEAKHSRLFLILAIGLGVDIICYYIFSGSSYILFAVFAFVIYTIIVFVTSMLDTTKKAQLDSPTGLINKSRWNELMENVHLNEETIAITMIDLNNLKTINDTYGHEIGDQMISEFSKILKSAFPANSVLCRWGGDEFVVMTEHKHAEMNADYVNKLQASISKYNANANEFAISYGIGSCLSSEFPEAKCSELLAIADKRMYENKVQTKAE